MVTRAEVDGWINEPIWVVYSLDTRLVKKLYISVGFQGFRVTHGKEIVYEGPNMDKAIEAYNKINSLPLPKDTPKLSN